MTVPKQFRKNIMSMKNKNDSPRNTEAITAIRKLSFFIDFYGFMMYNLDKHHSEYTLYRIVHGTIQM